MAGAAGSTGGGGGGVVEDVGSADGEYSHVADTPEPGVDPPLVAQPPSATAVAATTSNILFMHGSSMHSYVT